MMYLSPILFVIAVYVAHVFREESSRRRIAGWAERRECLTDDKFYIALDIPSIAKDAAISVRAMVSGAVRIPKELIGPNDRVCELEKIGNPSHSSTVDYFEDMCSVASPKDDVQLTTVRDFVIEFGSKTNPPSAIAESSLRG
jgi:hypothetical protein